MPCEIIVVDNNSGAALREYLSHKSGIKLILNSRNELLTKGCNQGICAAGDDVTHFVLLNSDTEIRRADWLQRMINIADSSQRIGIVGTAVNVIRFYPILGYPDGHCMMIKKQVIEDIGLLDAERFPFYGSTLDFTARAFKKNYIYKIMPKEPETVTHYHGMSRREIPYDDKPYKPGLDMNIPDIFKKADLSVWPIPHFIWEIYKHLPVRPFYELTKAEQKIAKGKHKEVRR
jgi:GT2 family glycosyltransferase